MEIVCGSCKAKLNIPDEKLPQGQRVSIKCPRCQNKIVLDTATKKPDEKLHADQAPDATGHSASDSPVSSTTETSETSSGDNMYGLDDTEAASALTSYGEGEKLALIMVTDTRPSDKIDEALAKMEYHVIRAKNTQEAVAKMRLQNFDLVILSDLFDNVPLGRSPVMQYLNQLSMSVRRKMFILLISDACRTLDHMMAFAMSANLVINWKDLDKLSTILPRSVSDNEKFYKVFMDALKETGKV